MNDFEACRRDCQIGAKAVQNLLAAWTIFRRLCSDESFDSLLTSSLFATGVMRYAKPFTQARMEGGSGRYPLARLEATPSFSREMHAQLMSLRDTLIAHDDFTKIEPKLLFISIRPGPGKFSVPVQICVSNKCVSHPADRKDIEPIRDHAGLALRAITDFLGSDLGKLRNIALADPSGIPKPKYTNLYDTMNVPAGGAHFQFPDLNNDVWLVPSEPDFSLVQNGFRYDQMRIEWRFGGPEVIKLPDGCQLHIAPKKGH
jgi:hypothetical protein